MLFIYNTIQMDSRKKLGARKMSEEEYENMNAEMIEKGYSQEQISAFWSDFLQILRRDAVRQPIGFPASTGYGVPPPGYEAPTGRNKQPTRWDVNPAPPGTELVELSRDYKKNRERLWQSFGSKSSPDYEEAAYALLEDFYRQQGQLTSMLGKSHQTPSKMSGLDTHDFSLPGIDTASYGDGNKLPQQQSRSSSRLPPGDLDLSLFRDRTHLILDMRSQGYSDDEIGVASDAWFELHPRNGGRFKKSRIQNRKRKTMKSKKTN